MLKNKTSFFFAIAALLVYSQTCIGTVLHIDEDQNRIDLQNILEWSIDESGKAELSDLTSGALHFMRVPKSTNYPRSNKPYWFRLKLLSHKKTHSQWFIELAYTQLDYLDFYSRAGNGEWQHLAAGDRRARNNLNDLYAYPVFNIQLRQGEVTEVLLRVQSGTSIMVPLTLWRDDALAVNYRDIVLINGLFYGILLALIFYNLFLYPTIRDSVYLWFSLYLTSFVLFQFSVDGFAALYFWPNSPMLVDRATMVALWVCMGAGLRFTQLIGKIQQFSPKLNLIFHGLGLSCFLLAIVVAAFGPTTVFFLLPPLALVTITLIPISLWIVWRRGCRPAQYALLAFIPQLPGAFFLVARTLGWVEPTFVGEHLFIIGGAISAVLLSFALADSINIMREEHANARRQFSRQLIETQDNERKRLAAELHDGVGQNLSFLVNALKRLHRQKHCTLPDNIDEVARDAIEEIRTISHQLHPHLLDKLGLTAAIEAIAERTTEQAGMLCEILINEFDSPLPISADLHIYRIAQEALNNIVRHSGANKIKLSLRKKENIIEFIVEDNGKGLKKGKKYGNGMGLDNMRARAKLLGGKITFNAVSPHGFKLTLSIPAKEKK